MVGFELAVLELAREPEGQRRRVADRVPDVEARFAMLVGPALNVDFARALGPGSLAYVAHRPDGTGGAAQGGVCALEDLDAFEGVGLRAHAPPGARGPAPVEWSERDPDP